MFKSMMMIYSFNNKFNFSKNENNKKENVIFFSKIN